MQKLILILLGLLLVQTYADKEQWVVRYEAFKEAEIKDLDGWVVRKAYKDNWKSQCGKVTLVGGYGAFGKGATALKQITLPPHYKVKVNVQLWKIDSWDNESMYLLVDGHLWQAKWHYSQGQNLCGSGGHNDWKEAFYNIEFIVPHNSPTVSIVLTSNLDEDATNESWAFRDFTLSFLRCPGDCAVCSENKPATCFYWDEFAKSWDRDISIEGWTLDGEGKAEKNDCSGVQLLGGYDKLGRKANLWKRFGGMPPHFAIMIKVQMWKIDSWDNELFKVFVDDALKFQQAFAYNEGVDLCGVDTGAKNDAGWAEKITNIEITVPHKFPEAKVLMTSTLDEDPKNESWGVRDFQLFVAKCWRGCSACTGASKADCTSCQLGFDLKNGECHEGIPWRESNRFFFKSEDFGTLEGWKVENVFQNSSPMSECGTAQLFGGYNKFGKGAKASRTFQLPTHKKVRIMFKFYKIDSWDNEWMQLWVDGKNIFKRQFGFSTPGQKKLCGAPQSTWLTYIMDVDQTIDHSSTELNVMITSTLDQAANDESWGFREFVLLYEAKDDCVEFYSECNFKGQKYEICRDQPSLAAEKITTVKSIRIPPGIIVQGFNEEQYKGESVKFSKDQECLQDIQFSFIQQHYEVMKADDQVLAGNLRRIRLDQ